MYPVLKRYAGDLLNLFFPELCAGCGYSLLGQEDLICSRCLYHLPYTHFSKYKDNPVEKQFWGRVELVQAAAYLHFSKGSCVQNIMHQFKYNNQPMLGNKLGAKMGAELREAPRWKMPDAIIPVPLHPKKQRSRGYNQSEHIARGLAEALELPVITNMLLRPIITESQTHKSRFARFENMQHAFKIRPDAGLDDMHILLVDDVMTTGATLEACAQCILAAYPARISVVTLAYTD